MLKQRKESNVSKLDPWKLRILSRYLSFCWKKVIKMLFKEKEVREQGKQDQEAKSNIKPEPKVNGALMEY